MLFTDRTELLVGESNIKRLKNANIFLVGCGGVGGYVAEMLVRAGVGNITIMDFDKISTSNINRQIIALSSTVGKSKVDVLKQRLLDINPDCNVKVINDRLCLDNLHLTQGYDFIIDAIDCVSDKVELIKYCHTNNYKIISALGAGNRYCIPRFEVCDIYDTFNDGLAKVIRKHLRTLNIKAHTVVSTKEMPIKNNTKQIGSISYYPAMCGCVLSAYVVNKIIEE